MPTAQQPLLTEINPAITLEELVYNITNPAILTDIIAVYEQTINTGSKFQAESILHALAVKMNVLVTTQAQTNRLHQKCVALVKALAEESLKVLAAIKAMFAIAAADDSGSEINLRTKKSVVNFETINNKIRLLLQHFMNDIFEESGTDIKSLSNKYNELNKLLADDSRQQSWALKNMRHDMVQLKAYSKKLSLAPAKLATIKAYKLLPPFYAQVAALNQLIARKKQ